MLRIVLSIVSLAGVGLVMANKYHGYKVLRTRQLTPNQLLLLNELESESIFDFWKSASPRSDADIMSDPENLPRLEEFLNRHNISHSVMIEDVERTIAETRRGSANGTSRRWGNNKLDWMDYYSHEEINAFLEDIAATANKSFISVISIGKSYEHRDMKIMKISKAGKGKPNVWIEAGMHAREWISPAMATYLIDQLVNGKDKNRFIEQLNFHILPSANPDGYEYSRNRNRLWRKTRSRTGPYGCRGVDGNRNFNFHFGESGVSWNRCSQTYPGTSAFSESENRNIRQYLINLKPTPILAHSIHSYSQLWLYPYGYDHVFPANKKELVELAKQAVEALYKVHGKVFRPISSADLYLASGTADDWYKGVLGARFTYTTELRDTGKHGFLLPADQIIPSGEELWAAFKVMFAKMIELSPD